MPLSALVDIWNEEMNWVIYTIASRCPLSDAGAHVAYWVAPQHWVAPLPWRKTQGKSDKTQLKGHLKAYSREVMAPKKLHFFLLPLYLLSVGQISCSKWSESYWDPAGRRK